VVSDNPYILSDYNPYVIPGAVGPKGPGIFRRFGRGVADNFSSFARDLPNLYATSEEWAGRSVMGGYTKNADASWYNRYSPPARPEWTGAGDFARAVGRDTARELPRAVSLAVGPYGGAHTLAARAFSRAPAIRTIGGYVFNREFPVRVMQTAIDTGEYAPAIGDVAGFGAAMGTARGLRRLRPYAQKVSGVAGWPGRIATSTPGMLAGAMGAAFGAYPAIRPLANKLGGDVLDVPWQGKGRPFNEDYSFGKDGRLVFDPPIGKYPEWDKLNERGSQ